MNKSGLHTAIDFFYYILMMVAVSGIIVGSLAAFSKFDKDMKKKISLNTQIKFHSLSSDGMSVFSEYQCISFDRGRNWTLYQGCEAQKTVKNLKISKYDEAKSIKWFEKNYRCITGTYQKNGEDRKYHLRSIDGGYDFAFFDGKTGEFIDDAHSVTNESLKKAYSWHLLSSYVLRNGPISLDDAVGVKLLAGSGFTVKEKE